MRKNLIISIILIIAILSGLGYIVYKKYFSKSTQPQSQETETTTKTQTPAETATEAKIETDNTLEIVAKFNNYKTTINSNFDQLQNLTENDFKSGTPTIITKTQNLLEEFKKFITDNKTTLEQGGINIDEALKYVAEKQAFIEEKMSSRASSSSQSSGPPSSQSPSTSSLSISLPFDKDNFIIVNTGIWPFCVHGGDHPEGHGGIDFDLKADTEIKVVADGKIEEKQYVEGEGYNLIIVHDQYGLATGYTPIQNPQLQKGDEVKKDQVLGKVGTDLKGTPFLHFEVNAFQKGGRVCPYLYFDATAKSDFDAMFSQSHYPEQSSEPNICNCELVPVQR